MIVTGYRSRYRNAGGKEKAAILNEAQFITGITGSTPCVSSTSCRAPRALLIVKGETVKLNCGKKPANRKGKKIYTGEVTASLRLIQAFFRYKRAGNEVYESSLPPSSAGKCPSSWADRFRPVYPHRHRCRLRLDMLPVFPPRQGPSPDLRRPSGEGCPPDLPCRGLPLPGPPPQFLHARHEA
jgi:hypothetical protein